MPSGTGPAASAVPAVSWMRTFTMSMGWMQQVANMPAREPVAKGLAAFHTGLSAMAKALRVKRKAAGAN